jgi:hypothetical protein
MFPIATRSFRFLAFDPEVELLFDDEDFDETFFVVVVVVFASSSTPFFRLRITL